MILPFKHYESEVISGVIEGIVSPDDEDSVDYPSFSIMPYWLHWFRMNPQNMDGYLRNVGYRILGLGKELLFSDQSLLESVRKRYLNWLEKLPVSFITVVVF